MAVIGKATAADAVYFGCGTIPRAAGAAFLRSEA